MPMIVDALGFGEARIANVGAMKKAANSSSAGSRWLLLTTKKKRPHSHLAGDPWRCPPTEPSATFCVHAFWHLTHMPGGKERRGGSGEACGGGGGTKHRPQSVQVSI